MSKIPKHLIEKIKTIPNKSGIYKMKDIEGNIMYIGKSKSLQSRVKSYFYTEHEQNKIKQMVRHINDIEIITTDTHLEAQILECSLIKELKPIYNKQFKNHEKYVYLKIENDSRSGHPLSIVSKRMGEYCIGPYKSESRLREIIIILDKIYPIKKSRTRYEFEYTPLPKAMGKIDFEYNRECLTEIFLKTESIKTFLYDLNKKMEKASLNLQYERAIIYRDLIEHIKYIKNTSTMESYFKDREILMGQPIESGLKIFFISNNQVIYKKSYRKLTKSNIEAFVKQANNIRDKKKKNKDEKSELDFKKIIYGEIKNNEMKAKLFIDSLSEDSIKKFLGELSSKNGS